MMNKSPLPFIVQRSALIVWAGTLTALVLLFFGALQMDRPLLEFVRTMRWVWLEKIGDVGYLVGSGAGLIAISGLFVVVGFARGKPELRRAGLWGWIAHAVTALLVQGLKHGIGRPRPRLMRGDEFVTGPTMEPGLDSFPSGHASASFAVAAVVATHCPRLMWPAYGLAGFVSLTRVFRSSHFVSDVVAGVVLGVVIGILVVAPVRDWGDMLRHALLTVTLWLVVLCAVAWLAILPSSGTLTTGLLAGAGASAWLARVAQTRSTVK